MMQVMKRKTWYQKQHNRNKINQSMKNKRNTNVISFDNIYNITNYLIFIISSPKPLQVNLLHFKTSWNLTLKWIAIASIWLRFLFKFTAWLIILLLVVSALVIDLLNTESKYLIVVVESQATVKLVWVIVVVDSLEATNNSIIMVMNKVIMAINMAINIPNFRVSEVVLV